MRKKVLIISKSVAELSSEKVIDWIQHLGHDFLRLNGETFESKDESLLIESKSDFNILIDKYRIPKSYYSIWIRRWSDFDSIQSIMDTCIQNRLDPELTVKLVNSIYQDVLLLNSVIAKTFKSKKQLSNINQLSVNKINVLEEAKKHKLKVPEFIFTNRKKHLLAFLKRKKVILKDLGSSFAYKKNKTIFATYGELLDDKKIIDLPEVFFLSFFQEYIEKEYEIRAFFLNNKIYSMAIFSQKDTKTQVDFRRYNIKDPNRTVPYQLPKHIERKIINLMKSLDLQTGSIDMIKNSNGEYYFLEVNPVGQFGMVSFPCNYNIEYEIAHYLTS